MKPLKLSTTLTLLFAAAYGLAVLALALVFRLGLEANFQTYLDATQAAVHSRIMATLGGLHDGQGRWDRVRVAALGREALAGGLVLAMKDQDGHPVWDARTDDPGAVDQVFRTMEGRLQARTPWEHGRWETWEHALDTDHGAGGTMAVSMFEPRRLGAADLAFLEGIDDMVAAVALGGLVLSAALGRWTARRLVKPLGRLGTGAREMAAGRYVPPPRGPAPYAEFRDLEEALETLAGRLAHLQALRDTAGADTAHELRTPLANLRAQLEALEDGVLAPAPERFAVLGAEVRRLEALVQTWEDLERARTGPAVPAFCPEPAGVTGRAVETFQARAQAAGKTLETDLRPGPAGLPMAPQDWSRIVVNLLENALKYTLPGGKIRVGFGNTAENWVLTVDDNGPGIPVTHREAVFDRFYRVDPARSRGSGGLGLGLSLVKTLAGAAGGTVAAGESPWGGCRITVDIPGSAV